LTARLVSFGLAPTSAGEKATLFQQCLKNLRAVAESGGDFHALFVPGRIEVLGKHTDYAGGRSLLATTEKGFCLLARSRDDNRVRIVPLKGEPVEFPIASDLRPPVGSWSNYPMTVARRLAANFPIDWRGADVAFASDLPPAAGMSSSSALVTASFLVLARLNRLCQTEAYRRNLASPEDLAGYLGTIENGQDFRGLAGDRGVGTFGGSEDHTAMLCCRRETISQYSFCPVRCERNISFPEALILAVGCSGVRAEKTGSAMAKYNRVSFLVSAALTAWNLATGRNDPTPAAALASSSEAPMRWREILLSRPIGPYAPAELIARLEQFHAESNEIIPAAGDALAAGDVTEFGRCADRSQELAERCLGNQVPNTVFLARSARQLGALAASAFGAGFGGSVWAMIPLEESRRFLDRWEQGYREAFHPAAEHSSFFLTRPGPAAFSPTGMEW
jgi:galactokinase